MDDLEKQAAAAQKFHSSAHAVEDACTKLRLTGMNAVVSLPAILSSIRRASGKAAATDPALEAASRPMQSDAKSSHCSAAASSHAEHVSKSPSMSQMAVFAASSMQGGPHPNSPTSASPSQAAHRESTLISPACEIKGTSDATGGRQREAGSPSDATGGRQREAGSPCEATAHHVQGLPSASNMSEAGVSQSASQLQVEESNQSSSLVWSDQMMQTHYLLMSEGTIGSHNMCGYKHTLCVHCCTNNL